MSSQSDSLQPDSAAHSAAHSATRSAHQPPPPWAPLSEWQPEYSVGIGILDTQRQRIFELLRESRKAIDQRRQRSVPLSLMNEAIDSTLLHFAAEEVLMQAFGYPEALPHQLEHERLSRVLIEFQQQFVTGQELFALPLLDFLEGWLVRHILESDQRYAGFFAERGAKP